MKCKLYDFFNSPQFSVSSLFIKACLAEKITLSEFLLLVYLDNHIEKEFDIATIHEVLGISEDEVLLSFNSLLSRNLISLESDKDIEGRLKEKVSLNGLYLKMEESLQTKVKKEEKNDIFKTFEKELGRTFSPMEYEIMNAWLENNSEELILAALKEAVYNGVSNFRYIDTILYNWNKKGFKSASDVNSFMQQRNSKKEVTELFDYNWLEEDGDDE